jgi:type IV secretion system protein VirB1
MLPGMELMGCQNLAVPAEVMHHVVRVESSYNPYAIGVVGGRLARQPKNLSEAVATAHMLESRGYNFSLGLAQVNRYNLGKYGLETYEKAFDVCPNLTAGSRILAECHSRSNGDWGKSFSCYYSGNFVTGYRHGYVQKVYASIRASQGSGIRSAATAPAIEVIEAPPHHSARAKKTEAVVSPRPLVSRRIVQPAPTPMPAPQAPSMPPELPPQAGTGPAIAMPHTPQPQDDAAAMSGDLQPVRVQLVGASTTQAETESPIDKAFVF